MRWLKAVFDKDMALVLLEWNNWKIKAWIKFDFISSEYLSLL